MRATSRRNVNFFSRVDVGKDGTLNFVPDHSPAGSVVELRAEMNVLAILNTCQHPLDQNPVYAPRAVHVWIGASRPRQTTIYAGCRAGEQPRIHFDRKVLPLGAP